MLIVYYRMRGLLEMQVIIKVGVLPPSESFRSLVNFESRYGTNLLLFFCLDFVESMLIQFARASKLLLMFDP